MLKMEFALPHLDLSESTTRTRNRNRRAPRDVSGSIVVLLVCVLAGCRTASPTLDFPTTVTVVPGVVSQTFVSTDELRLPSSVEENSVGTRASFEGPIRLASLASDEVFGERSSLSLEDAIQLAIDRNPDLVAIRAGGQVAHAAYHVAETYPWNPQFQAQVAPYNRDRDGNDGAVAQQYVIVQTFEMGGQRQFRKGAASARWAQVVGSIEWAELTTVAQTTRLFFTALYQREVRDMHRYLADLNERLVGIMLRRQAAGQASSADVQLTRLQAQSSRQQQRLAEASYETAIINLRNQLNLEGRVRIELPDRWVYWQFRSLDDVFLGHPDRLIGGGADQRVARDSWDEGSWDGDSWDEASRNGILHDSDAMLSQLVTERPDVVAARAAVAGASENVRLAKAMRRPDLQVGPMWQRDDASTEFWGIQGQFDIPVVNTGTPLVRQRCAELRQQQVTAAQVERRAVLEVRSAIERYQRARRMVEQSEGAFAAAVPAALKPVEDQFMAGRVTLLEVFATRAALVQSRQGFLDLLNELAQAAADVAQATGLPPQQLIRRSDSSSVGDSEPVAVPEELP